MELNSGEATHVATAASAKAEMDERSKNSGSMPNPRPPSVRGARYSSVPLAALVPYDVPAGKPRTPNVRRPSPTE